MSNTFLMALRRPGTWIALAIMVAAYFLADPTESAVYWPLKELAGLRMIQHGLMAPGPYAVLMLVRLAWNALLLTAVWLALGRPIGSFPVRDAGAAARLATGWATGLAVMVTAILAIVAAGSATVSAARQPLLAAVANGTGWLVFDVIGAAGEELYGRAAVLLVASACSDGVGPSSRRA